MPKPDTKMEWCLSKESRLRKIAPDTAKSKGHMDNSADYTARFAELSIR